MEIYISALTGSYVVNWQFTYFTSLQIRSQGSCEFYLRLRWHLPKASMGFTLGKNYVGLI